APAGEPPSDWPIWQPLADPTLVQAVQPAISEPELSREVLLQETLSPAAAARQRTSYRIKLEPYRAALKRVSPDDTLFWKTATLASTAAVIALLVAFSFHRFSPMPTNLENPAAGGSGEVQPSSVVESKPQVVVESKPQANVPRAAVKTVAAESLGETKSPLVE